MMSKFNHAIQVVLKHEGGYVNHPNDPGGETNFGISKRSYPKLDIKNLTEEKAIQIYKKDWWDRFRYDRIDDVHIATKVFDLAVNKGPRKAHKLLQKAINLVEKESLVTDGIIGPKTLSALNNGNKDAILKGLKFFAAEYYYRIVSKRSSFRTFLLGWLNRAYF